MINGTTAPLSGSWRRPTDCGRERVLLRQIMSEKCRIRIQKSNDAGRAALFPRQHDDDEVGTCHQPAPWRARRAANDAPREAKKERQRQDRNEHDGNRHIVLRAESSLSRLKAPPKVDSTPHARSERFLTIAWLCLRPAKQRGSFRRGKTRPNRCGGRRRRPSIVVIHFISSSGDK